MNSHEFRGKYLSAEYGSSVFYCTNSIRKENHRRLTNVIENKICGCYD